MNHTRLLMLGTVRSLSEFDATAAMNVSVTDTLPSDSTRVKLHDVDIQRFAADMEAKQVH